MNPDEEWERWVEWLGEGPGSRNIWREVTDMLARREIWDSFAVVYNIALREDGPEEFTNNPNFPAWIKNNYLDAQLIGVRRQLDMRDDVISLARLVKRVFQHCEVLFRARNREAMSVRVSPLAPPQTKVGTGTKE
jgi:hypothetical protein